MCELCRRMDEQTRAVHAEEQRVAQWLCNNAVLDERTALEEVVYPLREVYVEAGRCIGHADSVMAYDHEMRRIRLSFNLFRGFSMFTSAAILGYLIVHMM